MLNQVLEFINLGDVDEDGWSIQNKHFLYHPREYGIATLTRIGIKIRGHKIVFHRFDPHAEVKFHDHPWSFVTICLWGSYVDESVHHSGLKRDRLKAGSIRYRSATHRHRTSCEKTTYTFVVTSRKQRDWCMGTPERWVCGGKIEDFDALKGMVKVNDE